MDGAGEKERGLIILKLSGVPRCPKDPYLCLEARKKYILNNM